MKKKEELKKELLDEMEQQRADKKMPECIKYARSEWANGKDMIKAFDTYKAHKIYADVRDIVRIMYGKSSCAGLRIENQEVAKRMFDVIFSAILLAEYERKESLNE